MNNIRIVNLGKVNSTVNERLDMLAVDIPQPEPLVTIRQSEEPTLYVPKELAPNKQIDVSKIPADVKVVYRPTKTRHGFIFTDDDVISVMIMQTNLDGKMIENEFIRSAVEVLKTRGIIAGRGRYRLNSNDIVFRKDGKEKKFCGMIWIKDKNRLGLMLTLKFNVDKVPGLFTVMPGKYPRNVKEITDVVGGLKEADPTIGPSIVDQILENMFRRIGWNVVGKELTAAENEYLGIVAG